MREQRGVRRRCVSVMSLVRDGCTHLGLRVLVHEIVFGGDELQQRLERLVVLLKRGLEHRRRGRHSWSQIAGSASVCILSNPHRAFESKTKTRLEDGRKRKRANVSHRSSN